MRNWIEWAVAVTIAAAVWAAVIVAIDWSLTARAALPPDVMEHAPTLPQTQTTVTCGWRIMAVLSILDFETLEPLRDLQVYELETLPAQIATCEEESVQ